MPCFYSHHLFGQRVLERLPDSQRDAAQKYVDYYKLGLQGPDPYFYYLLSRQKQYMAIGEYFHTDGLPKLWEHMLVCGKTDPTARAYFMGFICHYSLDRAEHPYVVTTICGDDHSRFEMNIDSQMWEINGADESFRPLSVVPKDHTAERGVSRFFSPLVEEKFGYADDMIYAKGCEHFRTFLHLSFDPYNLKRPVYRAFEKITNKPTYITGVVFTFRRDKVDYCNTEHREWTDPTTGTKRRESFLELFDEGVAYATKLIGEAFDSWERKDYSQFVKRIESEPYAMEGGERNFSDSCFFGEQCVKVLRNK